MKTNKPQDGVIYKIPGHLQVETVYGKAWSLSMWDGLKFHHLEYIDGEESKWSSRKVTILLLPGFQGSLYELRTDRYGSVFNYGRGVTTLIGFSAEELSTPVSIIGWNEYRSEGESYCSRVQTTEDYLLAMAAGSFISLPEDGKVHSVSGNRLVQLPREDRYSWAAHYIVVSPSGEIVSDVAGEGDFYPEVINGLKDWGFTSDFERSFPDVGDESLMKEATEAGLLGEWGNVLEFLREGYRTHRNPLKHVRKDHPGLWVFIPKDRLPLTKEGDIIFSQYDLGSERGWKVLHRPVQEALPEDMNLRAPGFGQLEKLLKQVGL